MTTPLYYLTVEEASRLIAAKKLSSVELVEAHLTRIRVVDADVKSYILVDGDAARAAARQAEAEIARGAWRGPLHGIPFGAKDNFFTSGLRTCANSRVLADHIPDFDATIVARLKAAGAILLGKLNTWEFGTGTGSVYHDALYPHARNPWKTNGFTGGSSTGSGAAVAAGTAMFSLGADTGGSIRMPAAGCGLHGLKPTYGLVSRHGILPNCWSLDVPGPLTRTAGDAATILNAIAGHDDNDLASAPGDRPDYAADLEKGVTGLRIGVLRDRRLDDSVRANLDDLISVLAELGAFITEVELPMPAETYRNVTALISGTERATVHERDFREKGDLMGRELREAIMGGMAARAVDYVAAQRRRRELALSMDALVRSFDALVTPCACREVPGFDTPAAVKDYMTQSCTTAFNVSGHPAHAIPTGFDKSGAPTGAQIVGRYFDEVTVLRVARAFERARPETVTRHPDM